MAPCAPVDGAIVTGMPALRSPLSTFLLPLALLAATLVGTGADKASAGPVVGPVVGPVMGPVEGRWPLRPRPTVVRPFEPPTSRWGVGHRGVDLLGRPGQAVHSALAGRVTFAGTLAGRGIVVVDHGGRRTTYEPVRATVSVGDEVTAGAVLGRLETGGSHCFPHVCLHWGLISSAAGGSLVTSDGSGGHYLDPLLLVGAGPVRLLPLRGSITGPSPLQAWDAAQTRLEQRPGLRWLRPGAGDPLRRPSWPVETSLVAR